MLRSLCALLIFSSFLGYSSSLSCLQCSSDGEGQCSEDEPGTEVECEPDHGCWISSETGGDGDLFIRDCSTASSEEDSCLSDVTDGVTLKSCMCSSELCNRNWVSAGSTEGPGPTDDPTEPADKTIKCYSCDSNQGEGVCDDEHAGTETDCGVNLGCNINRDKNLFSRGCSVDNEPGCQEDGDTRTCNCMTELCNHDWTTAGGDTTNAPTEPADKSVKCYSCDSNQGDCDEEHAGTETDCPVEAGCTINRDKNLFFRGCSVDGGPGCLEEGDTRTCNCMTGLCNFDWITAGGVTTTTQPTPAGPSMKCYRCDSLLGDCTDEVKGEEVDCPETNGCTISKTVTNDGSGMIRDCSSESDVLCDTIDNGDDVGGTTQFCNCNSPLCNADWSSAGSTSADSTTTTSSISTTSTTTTTTSTSPEAATKTFALTLGIACALSRLL